MIAGGWVVAEPRRGSAPRELGRYAPPLPKISPIRATLLHHALGHDRPMARMEERRRVIRMLEDAAKHADIHGNRYPVFDADAVKELLPVWLSWGQILIDAAEGLNMPIRIPPLSHHSLEVFLDGSVDKLMHPRAAS